MADYTSSADSRGFSTTVEYTMVVVVFVSLFSGIAFTMQSDVSSTSEDVAKNELDRATEELATSIVAVDDVVENKEGVNIAVGRNNPPEKWQPDAQVKVKLPDAGGALKYTVAVDNGNVIAETQPTSSIDTTIRSNLSIDTTNNVETIGGISGGSTVRVYYNSTPTANEIQIKEIG